MSDNMVLSMAEHLFRQLNWRTSLVLPAVAGASALLWLVVKETYVSWQCRHIPCPDGWLPLLGHSLKLLQGNVWETFKSSAQKLGHVYRMHVLGTVYIVVSDPALVRHILQSNIQNYRKDPALYSVFHCLLGTGIVTSEGDRWAQQRRQLAPTFKLEILESVGSAAFEVTHRLFETLDAAAAAGTEVDMSEMFRCATLQVISLAMLGISPEESDRELANTYVPIIDECNDRVWYPHRIFLPTPTWFKHQRLVGSLNQYLETKIRGRWESKFAKGQQEKPSDIMDRILGTIDPAEFNGRTLQDLRDGIKTFLFAGHDTTSCMLTWALWELMENPDCCGEVCAEANTLFAGAGSKPDAPAKQPPFETLRQSLGYTFNVLRETLRKHSVVPVLPRALVTADKLGGVDVPPGAIALICMHAVHHRADLWPGGDTSVFRPARFGAPEPGSPQTGLGEGVDQWAFLPFSHGPRNCLGQHFSMLEARVILALLARRYKFRPAPGHDARPHPYKIPITPIDGLRCIVERRT